MLILRFLLTSEGSWYKFCAPSQLSHALHTTRVAEWEKRGSKPDVHREWSLKVRACFFSLLYQSRPCNCWEVNHSNISRCSVIRNSKNSEPNFASCLAWELSLPDCGICPRHPQGQPGFHSAVTHDKARSYMHIGSRLHLLNLLPLSLHGLYAYMRSPMHFRYIRWLHLFRHHCIGKWHDYDSRGFHKFHYMFAAPWEMMSTSAYAGYCRSLTGLRDACSTTEVLGDP